MRFEIHMRSGHLFWAKYRPGSELIDLQALFDDYWNFRKHEITVLSKSSSPSRPPVFDREAQRTLLSLESITRIVGLLNYNFLQALTFVSLLLHIPAI